ncbi:questin oxidase family protein [Photobacterium leiognathi]|uniref:questin oxidase family protein n=1 Tax=Photobacterium leiognathi TaxID=553611 RepID=UPI002734A046|nr:questin oxidase family protein [Photobacterium leiognathi]
MKLSLLTNELISTGLKFQPTYQKGLTNHLPMTLVALDQMGAEDERLLGFYHQYITQLENVARNDAFLSQANKIEQLIKRSGIDATLQQYLPKLIASFASQAFHCLIRLAYAVKSQQPREIAYSLAYWEQNYRPLAPLATTDSYNAAEQLKQLTQVLSTASFHADNISERINEVAKHPNYLKLAAVPCDITLESALQLIIKQYKTTNDFTLLHGITALHAFIELSPYFSDQTTALHWFWQSYTAAFATACHVFNHKSSQTSAPHLSWLETLSRGSLSHNDHTIKLIYSCSEIYKRYPFAELKQIAHQRIAQEGL